MNKESGYLEVVVGPMFSGKTSELQRRLRLAKIAGKKVIGFKYSKDMRYGEAMNTHDSISFDAVPFSSFQEILDKSKEFEVVGVDEVQFAILEDNYSSKNEYEEQCAKFVKEIKERLKDGVRFICAGLPTNFRGEPFNYLMNTMLGFADSIDSFSALCTYKENTVQCNNKATRTQRIVNGEAASYDDPLTLIGAKENYEARCPLHHFVPRVGSRKMF